ncbi:hypothetical protein H4S06_004168 [Coemansia sp. BCRC 34490]|nr:hypothetical protein H4S06_004168 [Coemansia sp. BCRC 34490]
MLMQMRRELDEARDLMGEREAAVEELGLKNKSLELQCSDLDARYEKLLTEYEDMLEQSIVAEEQQDNRDNETIIELKQKLEDHYNNKIAAQKAQLDTIQADLQRRVEEISKSATVVRELRSENRELQARVETLAEERSKADAASAAASAPAAGSAISGGDVAAATEHAMLKEREMHMMRREMAQRILEYDTMRKSLMRDVQNRCEKIIELEMALDDARSQITTLSHRTSNPNQPQRMQLLEKNVAQLTLMQKELVMQNSDIKKQVALSERKLQARTERIAYLESRLQDSNNQAEAWRRKAEELQSMRNHEASRSATAHSSGGNVLRFSRIAKPMRGGGGNAGNGNGNGASVPVPVEEKATGRSTGFFSWGGN